jgi:hypothetical protein
MEAVAGRYRVAVAGRYRVAVAGRYRDRNMPYMTARYLNRDTTMTITFSILVVILLIPNSKE